MNTETYLEGRIAKLESEISDKTLELASCIQPTEWSAFAKSATNKVDKAYEAFCTSIRWRVHGAGLPAHRPSRWARGPKRTSSNTAGSA